MWGSTSNGTNKIHLLNWSKVCSQKSEGGLGLIPLKAKNMALLAKWWWRAYHERDLLWNKILKERYGVYWHYDLNQVRGTMGGSHIIKSFLHLSRDHKAAQLLKQDCFK